MTKTNFDKLVRWDADYYNQLTDDDCIVCLTEREVYLIGQITDMLRWKNTRWIGNLVGLDFDLIASNLEYKLSERMTCQNITKLIEKLQSLETKIDYVFEQTVINEGDTLPTKDTPANEVTTYEKFAEDYTYTSDACDTTSKDKLYGAVYNLVRYINQVNIDALQNLSQLGNIAQQVDKLISAATGGLTPLDEVAAYTDFLVNELLDEYEATVDEALLEQVTCDLFCIAVSSNCNLNLSDVINYYGSKIGSTAIDLTSSLANVMQFALIGTFSGDEYFYFMTTFQFITVALTDHFFSVDSMNSYMVQIAVGANSPDNDWTLLCDECVTMWRLWTHNFAYGLGDFTVEDGLYDGSRVVGTERTADKWLAVTMPFDPAWRVVAAAITHERVNGTTHGGLDSVLTRYRATPGTDVGNIAAVPNGGFLPNGEVRFCDYADVSYFNGVNELWIAANVTDYDPDDSEIYLTKVEILFEMNYAPIGAVITTDSDICD